MQLNLPIMEALGDAQSILIAGVGGGFDVFAGLPLYFTLRDAGKTVHLANYSFNDLGLTSHLLETETLITDLLIGVRGRVNVRIPHSAEGYLAEWFAYIRGETTPIWMFANVGAAPLTIAYQTLQKHLGFDALILVDGGVDSVMRGDEYGAGTLVEDTISLAAAQALDVPIKILACVGFGTEVEEAVCHYNALENMAALVKADAFYGACALTPHMPAFQLYESACRYVWEQPGHPKSHISTRIIPAVRGEFGNHHSYDDHKHVLIALSPLMSLYWCFNAQIVAERSLLLPHLRRTREKREAFLIVDSFQNGMKMRPRRPMPY
jgi:hypothetical protein